MLNRLLAVALVGAAACSSSAGRASPSVHVSPSAASTPTVTLVSPSPTPSGSTADLPLSTVGFSCRLPVVTFTTGGDGISYQGGFISFPSATYTEDPNGLIIASYPSGILATSQTPRLNGVLEETEMPFFDAATGRWTPSAAADSAPSGASYAYATDGASISDGSVIHVVNAATGTEKTFHVAVPNVGAATGVQVMNYDGLGVFFVVNQFESYPVGMWRLDVSNGGVSTLSRVGAVMAVTDGFVWAGGIDPQDPNPPRVPASRELFDRISQEQITTGSSTTWFDTPGRSEYLLGLASGDRPVVSVSDAPGFPPYGSEVRIIDHALTGGEDNGELVSQGGISIRNPQADGDRTWFGSDRGVYLYTAASGLQKVFAFNPDPITGKLTTPAGFCR
jgi:hypothetical protein